MVKGSSAVSGAVVASAAVSGAAVGSAAGVSLLHEAKANARSNKKREYRVCFFIFVLLQLNRYRL
jgi:hypothetical protein